MNGTNIELESDISGVIIYQTGVQIAQTGQIDLEKGLQTIKITNLSEYLDKESLRVKGRGNAKIVDIKIDFNSKKEYQKEEYEQLEQERKIIEKKLKKLNNNKERIAEQLLKYKSAENIFYEDFPKSFAFGEVEMSKFLEFNAEIDEIIATQMDKLEEINDRIEEQTKELTVVNNRISKLAPIEQIHNFYEVFINLDVKDQGKFTIELHYNLNKAWWTPFYDVSLHEDEAVLTMMANVYNRTGMDWENVDMEISTASLKPISLIKPSPMILTEYIPPSPAPVSRGYLKGRASIRAPSAALKKDKAEYSRDDFGMDATIAPMEREVEEEEEALPEVETTYADRTEHIGVQSFTIPNKITIPSDKNPHPVNLTVLELKNEKRYFWSSGAPENVVIQDKVINDDLLLLPGNVKIYYNDEFLGETSIPLIAPKEEFNLGTRVSYDLKIEKKLLDRSKDKKAIKGKLKNNYEYKISIKNLKEIKNELILYDSIPHSNSEAIKVEIEEIVPEPKKQKLGVLKWKFDLRGIKEKEIKYKYYIEYKKDIIIKPPLP